MKRRNFFKSLSIAAIALITPISAKPAGKVLIACGRPNLNGDVFMPPLKIYNNTQFKTQHIYGVRGYDRII